jgi:hypothetical protein
MSFFNNSFVSAFLGPNDRFVVLASDGIWDVLDNKTVARIVLTFTTFIQQGEMVTDGDNLKWIARKLCDHAKYVHVICVCVCSCFLLCCICPRRANTHHYSLVFVSQGMWVNR